MEFPDSAGDPPGAAKLLDQVKGIRSFRYDKVVYLTKRKLKDRNLKTRAAATCGYSSYGKTLALVSTHPKKDIDEGFRYVSRRCSPCGASLGAAPLPGSTLFDVPTLNPFVSQWRARPLHLLPRQKRAQNSDGEILAWPKPLYSSRSARSRLPSIFACRPGSPRKAITGSSPASWKPKPNPATSSGLPVVGRARAALRARQSPRRRLPWFRAQSAGRSPSLGARSARSTESEFRGIPTAFYSGRTPFGSPRCFGRSTQALPKPKAPSASLCGHRKARIRMARSRVRSISLHPRRPSRRRCQGSDRSFQCSDDRACRAQCRRDRRAGLMGGPSYTPITVTAESEGQLLKTSSFRQGAKACSPR